MPNINSPIVHPILFSSTISGNEGPEAAAVHGAEAGAGERLWGCSLQPRRSGRLSHRSPGAALPCPAGGGRGVPGPWLPPSRRGSVMRAQSWGAGAARPCVLLPSSGASPAALDGEGA